MVWACLAGVLLLMAGEPAPAAVAVEHQLKAEFLWRFTLFVEWPEQALTDSGAPFVIGTVGGGPLAEVLETGLESHTVAGRQVQLRRLNDLAADADALQACHLVYIPSRAEPDLEILLARTAHLPILTVGDGDGFASRGVLINLYEEKDQLHFEINPAAVRRSGLEIRSRLYRLARLVGPEEG